MAEDLGNAILRLSTDSSKFNKGVDRAEKRSRDLNKALKRTGVAAIALGASLATAGFAIKKAFDFARTGAQLQSQRQAFENLAKTFKTSGRVIIDSLKAVSKGAVDTASLVDSATKAMLLGIDPKKFAKLMEIARAASKATGDTITKSFSDISVGIGRMSKLILDNLGIIVGVESATNKYAKQLGIAASAMTDAQKKQAFLNATLEAGQAIIDGVANRTLDFSDRLAQLTTSFTEFFNEAKIGIASFLEKNVVLFEKVEAFIDLLRIATGLQKKLITEQETISGFAVSDTFSQGGLGFDLVQQARVRNAGRDNEAQAKALEDTFSDLNDEILLSGTNLQQIAQDGKSAFALMKEGVFELGTSFSDSLIDMVTGSEVSFKSILSNFFKMISKMIAQIFIVKPLMDALFGAFGGGISLPTVPKSLPFSFKAPGLAEGGRVKARPGGTLFNIGEGGEDEVVTPLSKLDDSNGGGAKIEQNINISPGLPETVRAEIASFLPQFAQIAVDAVEGARRRGGSMALAMGSKT